MKRQILCVLLACLIFLAACAAPAVQETPVTAAPSAQTPPPAPVEPPAPSAGETGEYTVGDKLCGFTLIEEREMHNPPALLRLWEHDQTGAQAYFIHNDDQDRTFAIAFRTEPSDDTGKLHILEHAVCAASEKYPGRDVFFDAASQAYITTINATTYKSATNYFVSSMSEDQLERMADFYLDCAFHSALRSDPGYFYREGWRYTMEDADAPITVDGIVYNEMKGVYGDIASKHYSHGLVRALFPDTYQKWDSGGDPEVIPSLSYEELIAFYDECYHPSNSISMFYGDVETERYLKLLDEGYFSAFEAQDSAGYSPGQQPFDEPVVYLEDFPVPADSAQSGSMISYAAVIPEGVDFSEVIALSVGMNYIGDSSTPLMEALYASGIGSNYYAGIHSSGSQFYFYFTADEADPDRAEEFKTIVLEELSAMLEGSIDTEMLDSIFAATELSNALVSNQEGIGVMMAGRFATAIDSGYMEQLEESAYYDEARALCSGDGLADLLRRYLFDNNHAALVITSPKPGLQEEQVAAQAEALAAKKAAMSGPEIEQLIADTAAFNDWNETIGTVPETIDKLRTETPDTVNAQLPVYNVESSEIDGVKLYTADVEGDAVYCKYIFDVSHLNIEELRTLEVYGAMMGYATEARDQRDISIAISSLIYDATVGVDVETRADGSAYPVFQLSFYTFDDTVDEAAALLMEMFAQTDLEANAVYFDTAIMDKMQTYYSSEDIAKDMAASAAFASSSGRNALKYAIYGLDNYNFLTGLAGMDSEAIAARFAAVREKALLREGVEVIAVGSAANKAARCETLLAHLPDQAESKTQGDWAEAMREAAAAKSIAFKANGTASYMSVGIDLHSLNLSTTGELKLLLALMQDNYMIPEFRFQMGAYSTGASLSDSGEMTFMLYRAPAFAQALARLPELPGEIGELLTGITQEELSGYQLSYLSAATRPYGPWKEAERQIQYLRRGVSPEARQAVLDEIRTATPERLVAALPDLQRLIDAAGIAVVAPETALKGNEELFDNVVSLP